VPTLRTLGLKRGDVRVLVLLLSLGAPLRLRLTMEQDGVQLTRVAGATASGVGVWQPGANVG